MQHTNFKSRCSAFLVLSECRWGKTKCENTNANQRNLGDVSRQTGDKHIIISINFSNNTQYKCKCFLNESYWLFTEQHLLNKGKWNITWGISWHFSQPFKIILSFSSHESVWCLAAVTSASLFLFQRIICFIRFWNAPVDFFFLTSQRRQRVSVNRDTPTSDKMFQGVISLIPPHDEVLRRGNTDNVTPQLEHTALHQLAHSVMDRTDKDVVWCFYSGHGKPPKNRIKSGFKVDDEERAMNKLWVHTVEGEV